MKSPPIVKIFWLHSNQEKIIFLQRVKIAIKIKKESLKDAV